MSDKFLLINYKFTKSQEMTSMSDFFELNFMDICNVTWTERHAWRSQVAHLKRKKHKYAVKIVMDVMFTRSVTVSISSGTGSFSYSVSTGVFL